MDQLTPFYAYLVYTGFFVLAAIFSAMINGLFLKFSTTLGIRQADNIKIVRWASTAKPAVGGISLYILFLISATVYSLFEFSGKDVFNLPLMGLIASCSLGFLVGLADDAYNTVPSLKFAGQLICAIVLVSTGIVIDLTDSFALNALFTVLWVVGIMNSINMLDNMDGIAAVVSIAIMTGCLAVLALSDRFFTVQTFMLIGVIGGLVGFLVYNFNPARIYMGDTGSQFLGVLLAGISIMLLWNNREPGVGGFQFKQLVMPALAFVMPVMDTATVFLHRLRRGQSPFVGGKDHTTHHLAYIGFTDRGVFYMLGGLAFVCNALMAMAFGLFDRVTSVTTFVALMGLVILFLVIQFFYLRAHPPVSSASPKTAPANAKL
ncbi:MAG TPA: MraY family glycosyltransferase [Chitinophagales bacterium]|nr:MraY family glycosyltransferase [Chitinophagales bacterium]